MFPTAMLQCPDLLPAGTQFCNLEAQLGYDLSRQALTTTLTANRKARGKDFELKAAWAEMTGQWNLGASIKPHSNHKLVAT